jgi:hypothetical protein
MSTMTTNYQTMSATEAENIAQNSINILPKTCETVGDFLEKNVDAYSRIKEVSRCKNSIYREHIAALDILVMKLKEISLQMEVNHIMFILLVL